MKNRVPPPQSYEGGARNEPRQGWDLGRMGLVMTSARALGDGFATSRRAGTSAVETCYRRPLFSA